MGLGTILEAGCVSLMTHPEPCNVRAVGRITLLSDQKRKKLYLFCTKKATDDLGSLKNVLVLVWDVAVTPWMRHQFFCWVSYTHSCSPPKQPLSSIKLGGVWKKMCIPRKKLSILCSPKVMWGRQRGCGELLYLAGNFGCAISHMLLCCWVKSFCLHWKKCDLCWISVIRTRLSVSCEWIELH